MDQVANFIKETVSGTHDASTTTINVVDASAFPDPANGEYNLTWYDATNYPDPSDDPNKEIVRVTAYDTGLDTLTVTRGQESITATTKSTGGATYKLILAPTKKTMTDIDSGWSPYSGVVPTFTSTTSGVDTISFAGVDLTGDYQYGDWVKITSTAGTDLIYKVKSVSFSTNTTMEVIGETSVSGTITAISFSHAGTPFGSRDWRDIFYAYAARNTAQSIANANTVIVYFNDEITDPNNDYTGSTYTAPVTGDYEIGASVGYDTNDVGYRRIMVYKNGSMELATFTEQSGGFCTPTMNPAIISLDRGDTINTYTYQNSGASLNTRANAEVSMTVKYVGLG